MKKDHMIVLSAILVGPALGLALAFSGIVLAPPYVGFSSFIFMPFICLGIPACILLGVVGKLSGWRRILAGLIFSLVVTIFTLTVIGGYAIVPSGMTNCNPIEVPYPKARYECVSRSSDDTSYEKRFTVEGRSGWSLMRIVGQN